MSEQEVTEYLASIPLATEPLTDQTKAMVEKGLEEVKQGRIEYIGSFAQYVDEEVN